MLFRRSIYFICIISFVQRTRAFFIKHLVLILFFYSDKACSKLIFLPLLIFLSAFFITILLVLAKVTIRNCKNGFRAMIITRWLVGHETISARRRGSVTARMIEDNPRGKRHKCNNTRHVRIQWVLNAYPREEEEYWRFIFEKFSEYVLSKTYA